MTFLLIGESLLLDGSGNMIHLRYLRLLEDFNPVGSFSWVVLYLHSCIDTYASSLGTAWEICEPLVLLEIWT